MAIAICNVICLGTLAYCLITGAWREGSLLTAFVALTGQAMGSLTGLLANTRTTPGTDADMPKGTITTLSTDKPSTTTTTVTADKPQP